MKQSRLQRALNWLMGPVPTSVVIAFVIGAVFIMIAGSDPISGYQSMFRGSFGSGLGIANTIQRAIPLVGMALAIAVAFRAGVINLGA
ncbi:MAG TPA: ABC transporter permease, partial [Actinomycetales bacterium]|nr:ABC transporter permease [Actinomycetales bacterium]